jgi:iron(III) transport system substrate-binding protein
LGAVLEHLGEQKTETWLKGVIDNMARSPKGGDTDQIKGVATGECGIAATNTDYLARIMRLDKSDTIPIKVVGMNQVKVQPMLDHVGSK